MGLIKGDTRSLDNGSYDCDRLLLMGLGETKLPLLVLAGGRTIQPCKQLWGASSAKARERGLKAHSFTKCLSEFLLLDNTETATITTRISRVVFLDSSSVLQSTRTLEPRRYIRHRLQPGRK